MSSIIVKQILSSIVIAKRKKKKILLVTNQKKIISLLNCLWVSGFIYGYTKQQNNYCLIFLKGSLFKNINAASRISFNSSFIRNKDLKKKTKNQPHTNAFLITEKGILSQDVCLEYGLGGLLFVI